MKNQRLVKALDEMERSCEDTRHASHSVYWSAYWSARRATSASSCWSAVWAAETNKEEVLKILKGKLNRKQKIVGGEND